MTNKDLRQITQSCSEKAAKEGAAQHEVNGSVQHVPGGARGYKVDVGAGQVSSQSKQCGSPCEFESEARQHDGMEPGRYHACRVRSQGKQEESEQQDLAAEPGAAPHLERAPRVCRPAKVQGGD